jgi:hypothetical protein
VFETNIEFLHMIVTGAFDIAESGAIMFCQWMAVLTSNVARNVATPRVIRDVGIAIRKIRAKRKIRKIRMIWMISAGIDVPRFRNSVYNTAMLRSAVTMIFPFVIAIAAAGSLRAQEVVKAVVVNEVVEIASLPRSDRDDFATVELRMNGKVIRKFTTDRPVFPEVIGTFKGVDAEYVLYRTSTGSGACAGGSLYVIKFDTGGSLDTVKDISISPILTTCLGEEPVFKIDSNNKGELVLDIAGYTINLEYNKRWVEKKTAVRRPKRRR